MTPGKGSSPAEGHGNPLQYPCLENPHGQRGLAGYSSWGLKESDTTECLTHTQETNRQAVYQHGSAFLGKGQPKIPRQLVTRGLNLKSGEGRIQNLVPEPAALGSGHAGLLLASSQAGTPLVRVVLRVQALVKQSPSQQCECPLGVHNLIPCCLYPKSLMFAFSGGALVFAFWMLQSPSLAFEAWRY